MRLLRHSGIRLAGALLLAVLVLVPLAESGHSHATRDLAGPCATCVVAHHSPAAVAPTIAPAAATAAAAAAIFEPFVAPVRGERSPRLGRAPPATSFVVSI
jgi:hypothetical protein